MVTVHLKVVLYIHIYYDDLSFIIAFTNNSAITSGGVMETGQESSFTIINSTFTNNRASNFGGVMYTSKCTHMTPQVRIQHSA